MKEFHRSPGGGAITACETEDGCKKLSCEECLKEIPADAAHSVDIQDYVHHFCGLDCLSKWQNRGQTPKASG